MNVNITDPIFHNEDKALAHITASRWPDGEPTCPHCGSTRTRIMGGKTQAGMHLCNDCRDKFTVRTGTVMERSHIPLSKWLLAGDDRCLRSHQPVGVRQSRRGYWRDTGSADWAALGKPRSHGWSHHVELDSRVGTAAWNHRA